MRSILVLVLVGCAPRDEVCPEMPTWTLPIPASGTPGPVVLHPRHRILSGVPPVMVLVIADGGPVEIVMTRGKGRKRTWRTKERTLPWPSGWEPLTVGERGRVTVSSCGRTDTATFERAAPLPPDLRWRSAREGVPWLLEQGLPMEALRLLAADPTGDPGYRTQALSGAGVPILGLWLER